VRKNTTGQYVAFQAISKTDGSDVITGTPVVYYTIDGGTQAQTTATAVHEGNGQWSVALSQAETNGDHIVFSFVLTGAVTQTVNVYTIDADLTNLDVAVSTRSTVAATDIVSGGAITTSGGAVSNVTLVATTTTNTDMRGTDGANTFAPDNASIAAILVDTGTDIPASIAALNDFNPATDTVANVTTVGSVTNPVTTDAASRTASQADVSALATAASIAALNDLSSTDVTNAVWDASTSSHNVAGSFGRGFGQVKEGLVSIDGQVNDLSATTTSFVTNLAAAVDDYYNGQTLHFISGSLAGQSQVIRDYSGTTKTITLDSALTSAPSNADEFIVLSTHVHTIAEIADGVWDESQSGHTTVGTFGYYLDSQVSALATQSSVNTIDSNVDAIKVKTDQLTFTNPNSVDATATADVDEAAIADAVIAGIGGTDVTISSVIAEDGTTITIVRGDDYSASDSRAITWTGTTDDQWPSLSGATLKFTAKNNMDSLTVTPTVTQPTGTQAFRMELTSTNTEIMSGRYKYDVQATLSSGRVITLVVGEMIVKQTYTNRP
jgi:hypothetical protein